MFPFFWVDKSQFRIRLLSFAAAHYEVMGLIAQALGLLPLWVRLAIIRYFTSKLTYISLPLLRYALMRDQAFTVMIIFE
jgi:hypothetical protein